MRDVLKESYNVIQSKIFNAKFKIKFLDGTQFFINLSILYDNLTKTYQSSFIYQSFGPFLKPLTLKKYKKVEIVDKSVKKNQSDGYITCRLSLG